jgi:hypothetical protein
VTAREQIRQVMVNGPTSSRDARYLLNAFEAEIRAKVLAEAADWLIAKYGITNRAAADLRRLAQQPTNPKETP